MAETSIEWADYTFNPWIGCTKVSAACDHCYAADYGNRFGVEWGAGKPRRRTSESNWKEPLAWNRKAARDGTRPRVFCASLADIFDQEVPDAWRHVVMELIRATPNLIWLLLTKRPKAMADWSIKHGLPANVWAGTTAEDQKMADMRVPELMRTDARVRFLSIEPMLGPISLEEAWHGEGVLDPECWGTCAWCEKGYTPLHNCQRGRQSERQVEKGRSGIDWVIAGGESGPKARPSHPDWFRSLRDQCAGAGVPFLFKQWGAWAPGENATNAPQRTEQTALWFNNQWRFDSLTPAQSSELHRDDEPDLFRVGKKAAGRLLDGVEHNGFPGVTP